MTLTVLDIDGSRFDHLLGFFGEIERVLALKKGWGRSFEALDHVLQREAGLVLRWRNAPRSVEALGPHFGTIVEHLRAHDGVIVEFGIDRDAFREALLRVMERKVHPAWASFTSGLVPKSKLHLHLEQEYAVFVRDFPQLVGRAYAQCPIAEVRRELAENLFEEETGGLHAGRPHPELFLEYPRGLGFDVSRFEHVELLPAAKAYREAIDDATTARGWAVAAAVVTLFIEGTPHERSLFDPNAPARPEPPLEEHPLVVHYGLPLESLKLTRAHRGVEGDHRLAAWKVMLDFAEPDQRMAVLIAMEQTLAAWLKYRDEVAQVCGV